MFKMDPKWLTQEALKVSLHYEPTSGIFTWLKTSRGGWVGKTAGWVLNNGYRAIQLEGSTVLAHRLAWFYTHGRWPIGEVDHRNRNRDDNSLTNLRDVPKSTNQANVFVRSDSTTGHTGVNWNTQRGLWVVRIQREGRRYTLGYFSNLEKAVEVRAAADLEHRIIERNYG